MRMKTLKNDCLTIQVSAHGAELTSIRANATGKEYLWQGDPAFWKRHSPVLFPIVGSLWEGKYRYEGKEYAMSQHGFARDSDFELVSEDSTCLRYRLASNAETLKIYPFEFELEIAYLLMKNSVVVSWKVTNLSADKEMFFQIGAHPAFYFPDFDPETSERGFFAFDKADGLDYIRIAEKGCISKKTYPMPLEDGLMPIDIHTFDIDTYILENSQIRRVSLLDKAKNPYISLFFEAPVVGLWSPPTKNAPFVCIEPWYGRCDETCYSGNYEDREWTNRLAGKGVFEGVYVIRID